MMAQRNIGTIGSTKRCLFPADEGNGDVSSSLQEQQENDCLKDEDSTLNNLKGERSPTSVSGYPLVEKKETTICMSDDGAEVMLGFSSMSLQEKTPDKKIRITNSSMDTTKTSPPANSCGACYSSSQLFGLEISIALCLGNSSTVEEDEWQAWSFDDYEEPSPKGKLFQNRAFSTDAKRLRVQQLRAELNPFTPKKKAELTKSRSFSIMDHGPAIVRIAKQQNPLNLFCTSAMPESSPAVIRQQQVCYDSDPEDFTTSSNKKEIASPKYYHTKTSPRQIISPTGREEVDIYLEESFCTVAQEFINSTVTLIFHSSSHKNVVVDAWVERGQSFGESLLQPRWMWKPKQQQQQPNKYGRMNAIDLLNIKRVLKVDQMDRCKHPFAKPYSCFVLRTVDDEELLFETSCSRERDFLVYSLKMVIARFGSLVLGQDDTVYEEFFATSDPVPGRVPDVLSTGGAL